MFTACCWATFLLFANIITCGRGYKHEGNRVVQTLAFCKDSPVSHSLLSVFLGVEAFFFGMFTVCMLFDQYGVLSEGASHIDQHKARKLKKDFPGANNSSWTESLTHVFGGDGTFSIWWLIPVDAKWKNAEREFAFMLPRQQNSSYSIDEEAAFEEINGNGPHSQDVTIAEAPSENKKKDEMV